MECESSSPWQGWCWWTKSLLQKTQRWEIFGFMLEINSVSVTSYICLKLQTLRISQAACIAKVQRQFDSFLSNKRQRVIPARSNCVIQQRHFTEDYKELSIDFWCHAQKSMLQTPNVNSSPLSLRNIRIGCLYWALTSQWNCMNLPKALSLRYMNEIQISHE